MVELGGDRMLKVGLTGGIGSGKSTVSNLLKERGLTIIDADIVAREVLELYPEILQKVRVCFGEGFFDESGEFKRKEFGNFIFAKEERRKEYEDIIIPYIKEGIINSINRLEEEKTKICILDAPTLIENGLHKYMNINILVWVDLKTQIKRVKNRDSLSEDQVKNRIDSQMTLEEKKKIVDYVIDNSSTIEKTKEEIEYILKDIGRKYREVECLKT